MIQDGRTTNLVSICSHSASPTLASTDEVTNQPLTRASAIETVDLKDHEAAKSNYATPSEYKKRALTQKGPRRLKRVMEA